MVIFINILIKRKSKKREKANETERTILNLNYKNFFIRKSIYVYLCSLFLNLLQHARLKRLK